MLNLSKINYLDPRITVAWCKKYEVPVTKLFSKTLLTKCECLSTLARDSWVIH